MPGYPDPLFMIWLLLMATFPMSRQSRLSLAACMLATHEGSFAALLPVILCCFPRREMASTLLLFPLYAVCWYLGTSLAPHAAVAAQTMVGDKTSFQWFLSAPGQLLTGIAFAYKLLWIPLGYVTFRLFREGEHWLALALGLLLLCPLILLPLGVDTSRLMGFGFFGLLVGMAIFLREYQSFPRRELMLYFILGSILVPSYYVDMNLTGIYAQHGLYPAMHQWIRHLAGY